MTDVSREDIAAQVEAELAKLKVSDVLLHTASTVTSLAFRRLAEPDRDLGQVQLAIESLKALTPLLEGAVPEDIVRDFRQVIASLQLAFADAAALR